MYKERVESVLEDVLQKDECYQKISKETRRKIEEIDKLGLGKEEWLIIDRALSATNERCAEITPFAATSSLDNKDVILLTDDIEELFKICKLNRINTIFYYYGYPDISNYRIDIDKLIEELRTRYERKLDIAMFSLQYISKDYFADVLQNLVSKMQMCAEQQNQRIVGINENR